MRSLPKLLMILSLLLSVACSSKSTDKSKDKKESVEEDADFLVDSEDELLEEGGDDDMMLADEGGDMEEGDDMAEEGDGEEIEVAEEGEEAEEADEMEKDEPMIAEGGDGSGAYAADVEMSGEYGNYTVKRGDTLMLIAFKIYGDYTKWRSIANMNPGSSSLAVGSVIKFQKPARRFSWDPEGLPHLIRNGETLGTISNQKYGTMSKWKSIWNNNRPLIRDPNLIFAGFTVYYIPSEDRDVASDE